MNFDIIIRKCGPAVRNRNLFRAVNIRSMGCIFRFERYSTSLTSLTRAEKTKCVVGAQYKSKQVDDCLVKMVMKMTENILYHDFLKSY